MKRIFRGLIFDQSGAMNFSESLALKAVSLLLALILWITILGFKHEEMVRAVKFEPLVAPGMIITNQDQLPKEIKFTFLGPRVLLKEVEKDLEPIRPDFRRTKETTIPITMREEYLAKPLPNGVRVTTYSPNNIIIRLEQLVEKYVEVRPILVGDPKPGYRVVKTVVEPAKVAVTGPKSMIESLTYVGTEAFDTEQLMGVKEGVVSVEVDGSLGYQLTRERVVTVRVTARKLRRGRP